MWSSLENRKSKEVALLTSSSDLSPQNSVPTTLIALALKPNQVALTTQLHLLRVTLDKGIFFSGVGGDGAGVYLKEGRPCPFSKSDVPDRSLTLAVLAVLRAVDGMAITCRCECVGSGAEPFSGPAELRQSSPNLLKLVPSSAKWKQ